MAKITLAAFSDEIADSLKGQIEGLKRNDIYLTELRSIEGKSVAKFSEQESKEYATTLKNEGIGVWAIGSPLGKVDISVDFEQYKDTVKKICETALIFGTDKVRVFSFFNALNDREKVMDYLGKMVEIAKNYGVILYHENEKGIYGETADRVLDIMNNVKGLKFVYDPANYLQADEPSQKTIELFHKKTDYFHIKDVIMKTGELVPAGCGDGDINEIIRRIDRDVTFTLEPHLAVFACLEDIDRYGIKVKFKFTSGNESFDCAVASLKKLLLQNGYCDNGGIFIK